MRATRDIDGSYAMIYIPNANRTVQINISIMGGDSVTAHWFNPRTGETQYIGQYATQDTPAFTTPAQGPDWVLLLDQT